jgi:general secretion pathway protein C
LANGARIAEIYPDHVVLERDGKRVNLFVDDKKNGKGNELLAVGGQPQQVKPAVATYRDVLTDYIRPSPVYDGQGGSECWERRSSSQCDGDRIKGYQVYPGQRSGVFSQLGLQSGDVILALNDQPFFDPQQAQLAFKQLTDGQAVVATVERKGKVERVSLDGRLIAADQDRSRQAAVNPPVMPNELPR